MKKLLLILLTVLTCFNAEAIPITHAAHPARVAEKQQHEEEFHHGDLVYEFYVVDSFTFRESVPTIETYEIRKYYYEIDPDKCIIETKQVLKSLRPATEQKKMMDFVFTLVGATFVITIISIFLIIWQEKKKKLSIGYKEIC